MLKEKRKELKKEAIEDLKYAEKSAKKIVKNIIG